MTPTLRDSESGNATNTVITITLPTYLLTDYIVLLVSSNNANAQTLSANVTGSELASAGNRLVAYRIVPDTGSETSFTLTVGASSVFTWWIGSYENVDLSAPIYGRGTNVGTNTTANIEVSAVTLGYITSGNELALSAASVNATATWTTTGNTVFNTTSGNAAMQVQGKTTDADDVAIAFAGMDRGLGGTSRNESSVAVVLQPVQTVEDNLLTNGSFELGTTVATDWESEGTTANAPSYSVQSAVGVSDGDRAQKVEYAGQAGDSNTVLAVYQAPVDASPGDVLEFRIDLSGSKTSCTMITGLEAFETGGIFISESDTTITSLTGTPTEYTVQYTCPANTDFVAVFIQINEIVDASSITAYLDRARLVMLPSPSNQGAFFSLFL